MTAATSLSRFRRDESGVAAIEFAIIAPVLLALFLGAVTLCVAFQNSLSVEKASFTTADILSRQNDVTTTFLQDKKALFDKLLPASLTATAFRVSSVKKASGQLSVAWSWAYGSQAQLKTSDLSKVTLPTITEGDSLVILETTVPYRPLIASVGLSVGEYKNVVANRPRFTSAITKSN